MKGQAGHLRVVIVVIAVLIGLDKWREIGWVKDEGLLGNTKSIT